MDKGILMICWWVALEWEKSPFNKLPIRLLAIAEALLLALISGSTLVISRLALNFLGPFQCH
jgi:hypothetical protein